MNWRPGLKDLRLNILEPTNSLFQALSTQLHLIYEYQEQKKEALQNAVLNTALKIDIEEDLQYVFFNFIDELTASHLLVLKYFESPIEWLKNNDIPIPNYSSGGQDSIFRIALPEFHKNQEFAKRLITDLAYEG